MSPTWRALAQRLDSIKKIGGFFSYKLGRNFLKRFEYVCVLQQRNRAARCQFAIHDAVPNFHKIIKMSWDNRDRPTNAIWNAVACSIVAMLLLFVNFLESYIEFVLNEMWQWNSLKAIVFHVKECPSFFFSFDFIQFYFYFFWFP